MSNVPFIVGQWVRGAGFYGRAALIEEVLRGNRNWIWLLGTRRIGKTSLLRQLEYLALTTPELGYFPLFWDFQGADSLEELGQSFHEAMLDAELQFQQIDVSIAEVHGTNLFRIMSALRRRLRAKGLKLLLLCDEVEQLIRLDESNPSLLDKLRRAFQAPEGMRSVLASTIRLWALSKKSSDTSPFLHGFAPPAYIHNLSDEEAQSLIVQNQLSHEARPQFDEKIVETIRYHCDNHPYLLQLVCKRYHEQGDIDQVIETVAADPMVAMFFSVDFEMLSKTEQQIIRRISEEPSVRESTLQSELGVDATHLSGCLHRLQNLGYVRESEKDELILANYFFRRWLGIGDRPTRLEVRFGREESPGDHMSLEPRDPTLADSVAFAALTESVHGFVRRGGGHTAPEAIIAPDDPTIDDMLALWFLVERPGRGVEPSIARALCEYARAARSAGATHGGSAVSPVRVFESLKRKNPDLSDEKQKDRFLRGVFQLFGLMEKRIVAGVDLTGGDVFEGTTTLRLEVADVQMERTAPPGEKPKTTFWDGAGRAVAQLAAVAVVAVAVVLAYHFWFRAEPDGKYWREARPGDSRGLVFDQQAAGPNEQPLYRERYAIVIGIDDYEDEGIQDLSYAVSDAKAFAELLRSRFGFEDGRIFELYDAGATRENIAASFERLKSTVEQEDSLLVFWAGHGTAETAPHELDFGYLVPHDGTMEGERTYARNFAMRSLKRDLLPLIPAKHKLIIVDTCFGGLITRSEPLQGGRRQDLVDVASREVTSVLTAGASDQVVLDGGGYHGHSVFTGHLIQFLEEVNDFVTVSEMFPELRKRVSRDARNRGHSQTPVHSQEGEGDYVFVARSVP